MQNHILDDHKDAMMASSAPTEGLKAMDLKSLEQQQQLQPQPQQQPLRCPRCDSSNTKFCYYNNYSLSQPRHFCKACKRYWTRGGTLRNVPVGGGCRKNKRVRRPSSSPSSCLDPPANPSSHINALGISSSRHSPLLFGLPGRGGAASDVNPAFPCFINSHALSGYELHPQLNALGLGFTAPGGQIGDLSKYGLFGSSSSSGFTADISPMIAVAGEVLGGGSGHQQQRLSSVDNNNGLKQNFPSFEEWQVSGAECGAATNICQMEQAAGSGRPEPSVYWNGNAASVGGWSDLGNMGSSVTSLI